MRLLCLILSCRQDNRFHCILSTSLQVAVLVNHILNMKKYHVNYLGLIMLLGDWGRNLVLWTGRMYGGLSLLELGKLVGGVDYSAVSMAVRRVESCVRNDRMLKSAMKQVAKQCAM